MHTVFARNVNDAYRSGMALAAHYSTPLQSRNGPVRRVSMPVTTRYDTPVERVLFGEQRNANPFFHLFESLWMLNGQNDLSTLTQFLPSFAGFSDDGLTLHGAYGYRWRHWPIRGGLMDQLLYVVKILRRNPNDRRAIIAMWNPEKDLDKDSKDIPCNDLIKVYMEDGKLDIQVYNRSNDIVFGAYGANAVHMSVLHEYLAAMIGVPMGSYYQISGDFHAYVEQPYKWDTYWPLLPDDLSFRNPYAKEEEEYAPDNPVHVRALVDDPAVFDTELQHVMLCVTNRHFDVSARFYANGFFNDVVLPMYQAHRLMQQPTDASWMTAVRLLRGNKVVDGRLNDWLQAGEEWCSRVLSARMRKRAAEGQLA